MKIYYFLLVFISIPTSYCMDKDDVYVEGLGLVSFEAEQKKKSEQKECDDTQQKGLSSDDYIQMSDAATIYQRVKEETNDEAFLRKTNLHTQIGGKKDKPCAIARQVSRALFEYFEAAPIMPVSAYEEWLKINVAFEKSLFKILFEKHPEVLKQEKIAQLSCALAEKWKFTSLV